MKLLNKENVINALVSLDFPKEEAEKQTDLLFDALEAKFFEGLDKIRAINVDLKPEEADKYFANNYTEEEILSVANKVNQEFTVKYFETILENQPDEKVEKFWSILT
jgi:hypothetical protein